MDWQTALSIAALVMAAIGFMARTFDKSLSIREHEEFKNSVIRDLSQVRTEYKRDDDRLEDRIKVLEATRPTTGELEARLKGSEPK